MAASMRPHLVEVERVPDTGAMIPAPAPDPAVEAERQARQVQAMSEGAKTGDTVTVFDVEYLIGNKVGLMPLMKFAYQAKKGLNTDELEGMAAMYELLQDCIHPVDWEQFERDMIAKHADGEDLFAVVGEVIEILSARPTRRRGGSSTGPSTTTGSSTASSFAGPRVPAGAEDLVPVDQLAASVG
jgi:hypothetical protein